MLVLSYRFNHSLVVLPGTIYLALKYVIVPSEVTLV